MPTDFKGFNRRMTLIQKAGFDYGFDSDACSACGGRCCRGNAGHVWISEYDVRKIGEFLGINRIDFIQCYTNYIDNRLSLKEQYTGGSYTCCFFDANRSECTIYVVRPDQCRRFPFWDYFRNHREELLKECPGIRERPK